MRNLFDIQGRFALVVGASSGIGEEFALTLAEQGANVAIAARRVQRIEALKEKIEGFGVKCVAVPCDVTSEESIVNCVKTVVETFGRIDILCNNAGIDIFGDFLTYTTEDWDKSINTDIRGMFTSSVYSGGALWNNTTITPGIGTARPYEYFGAPFIKPTMETVPMPEGVLMRTCSFTPSAGKYLGEKCYGYQIMLLPGYEYHSLLHTLQLMRYFLGRYSQFELGEDFHRKLSDPVLSSYLSGDISFQDAKEHVKTEEQKWIRKAKRFSLYDDQPVRMK